MWANNIISWDDIYRSRHGESYLTHYSQKKTIELLNAT